MSKLIAFTGGGTAGHVTPNLALLERFRQEEWSAMYIGSLHGMERGLVARTEVPYHAVQSGKLRRYFSWQNFIDPFKILAGIVQASFLFLRKRPAVLFSKGGFVAFPVVVAAWLNRIPVVVHESDMSPGLANRLSFPFAKKICYTFEPTQQYFSDKNKTVLTGTPIRSALFNGNKQAAKEFCGFTHDLPCLFIYGGGLGADAINQVIRANIETLTQTFNVMHLCGHGKVDAEINNIEGYKQIDYAHEELADLMAYADIIVSRAGANSVYELLVLKKPHILVPLSRKASRGDQIQNANYTKELGLSLVVVEEEVADHLIPQIMQLHQNLKQTIDALERHDLQNGTDVTYQLITSLV